MDNHTINKEKVVNELFERHNPESIGQLEKYPPNYDWFVTLYFKGNFTMNNYYNINVGNGMYDFLISNVSKVNDETMVTVKVNKQ